MAPPAAPSGSVASSAAEKLADFERRADPKSSEAAALLEEMRAHVKRLEALRRDEDPRLSFSTPEFKEAQRVFTDGFKKNFGRPVEWAMVRDHPWSTPQLRRLEQPVDAQGKPWAGGGGAAAAAPAAK